LRRTFFLDAIVAGRASEVDVKARAGPLISFTGIEPQNLESR
jgi:hypothetical protein